MVLFRSSVLKVKHLGSWDDQQWDQSDQIGRFFANWATFKSGWRFFKEINSPKKWQFLGQILGL
jgi:hypothetical protein